MKVRIYLVLFFLVSLNQLTVAISQEISTVDSSFSDIDFKFIENISNQYDINYSNGLAAYHNIKNISFFTYHDRAYNNFSFAGGYDINLFTTGINIIDGDMFSSPKYFWEENLTVPHLKLSFKESDIKAYYMKLFFSRPITSRSKLSINASGSENRGGENKFSYNYINTYENGSPVIFYSSKNQELNINTDLNLYDPMNNSIHLFYDASFSKRDNFSWLLNRKDTIALVNKYYEENEVTEENIQDSIYFAKMGKNLSNIQDSVFSYSNFGGNYEITRAKYKLLINGSENSRTNELGFYHMFRLGNINTNFSFFDMKVNLGYSFNYNFLESSDYGSKFYHKNSKGNLSLEKVFDKSSMSFNYLGDLDEKDKIYQDIKLMYQKKISENIISGVGIYLKNRPMDFIESDSLNLRVPILGNQKLLRSKSYKFGLFSSYKKFLKLNLTMEQISDDIITEFKDNSWHFNNFGYKDYKFTFLADFNLKIIKNLNFYTNILYTNKFYMGEDNILYNLPLYYQTGEYPYKLNFRLKKRFFWIYGKLLGNISTEARVLSQHSQQNLNIGGYNYLDINRAYILENSKIIYNLYTNLMFTKFVMYLNFKNIGNEIIYNDYGFRVAPLKLEWGFNWRLYN